MNPSVWDSPYSVGFDLYLHDFDWSDFYTEQRAGGECHRRPAVLQRPDREPYAALGMGDDQDLDTTAPEDAVKEQGRHERRSLTLSANYDRRNNVLLTSAGYRLGASVEMAGTAFGGDVNTLRETFDARKWWTVCDAPRLGQAHPERGRQAGSSRARSAGACRCSSASSSAASARSAGSRPPGRAGGPDDAKADRRGVHVPRERGIRSADRQGLLPRPPVRGYRVSGLVVRRHGRFPRRRGRGHPAPPAHLGLQRMPISLYLGSRS